MKIRLYPHRLPVEPINGSEDSIREFSDFIYATQAVSGELVRFLRNLKEQDSFDEIRGQFLIYREERGPIVLELSIDPESVEKA
ncbi:MAG: hypothetical protein ACFFEE_13020 [Candidatus Thorarchaeota archaeon]